MPRHIIESNTSLARYDDLVKSLVKELKAESGGPQPLILEQVAQPGPVRYVTVIWDKWKGVPEDVRPEVIVAAYEKAESKPYADSIMTAEGVTASEALSLGLLPYCVTPARREGDPVGLDEYRKVFVEEAKRTVLGAKAKELRYARSEDADAALERLTRRLPGSHWAVPKSVELLES